MVELSPCASSLVQMYSLYAFSYLVIGFSRQSDGKMDMRCSLQGWYYKSTSCSAAAAIQTERDMSIDGVLLILQ